MAVTISAEDLAVTIGASEDVATRLLAVTKAHIERYAPLAPEEVQNEAAIRFSGYLASSPGFGAYRKLEVGSTTFEIPPTHGPAFRNCGAMALLSPWKIRRAGAI